MKRSGDDAASGHAAKRSHMECTRLFIGGLSYSTTWTTLKDHFSQMGDVEYCSVIQKPDGTSKGCGMVNYYTADDAQRAVHQLNETMLDGRHIMVKLDLSGDTRRPWSGGSSSSAAAVPSQKAGMTLPPEEITRVFVGNLAFSTTWQAVKDLFSEAGTVEFASVLEHPDGTSKGCGMVNYLTHDEAMQAVHMFHDYELDGRLISVKLDVDGRFKERPPPKPKNGRNSTEYYSLPPEQICRVFVGNLSYNTNWQSLKDHFAHIGDIDFASVLLNGDRTSKGCGMVNFRTHEDAMRAVETLHDSDLDQRRISVKLDVDGRFKERPPPRSGPPKIQVPRSSGGGSGYHSPRSSGGGSGYHSPRAADADASAGGDLAGILGAITGLSTSFSGAGGGGGSLGHRGGAAGNTSTDVAALVNGVSSLAQSSAGMDVLAVLGQLAQTPSARHIDWPMLIRSVASSVR